MAVDADAGICGLFLPATAAPSPGDPDESEQPPDYGVSASLDGGVVELTLTFRRRIGILLL